MSVKTKRRSYYGLVCVLCILSLYCACFFELHTSASGKKYVDAFANQTKKTVVIDAGHGGEDSGAVGIGNVYEKNLNLEIAFKLGEYLTSAGYTVVYTRTKDKLLYTEEQNIKGMRKINDLKNRMNIANSYSDALFVSIHMNSFGSSDCTGLQVYYGVGSDESQKIADSVQSEVVKRLQKTNRRKTKSGEGIYLLENSTNPAILIECGFLSNPEECKKLSEKEYQKELSFAIVCGIIEYIEKAQ